MRSNLVFLMTDQQSRDGLGCYGNPDARTPRLDAMAEESLLFRHGVSNCPVCTPARGMLISGLHPLRNGAIHNDFPLLANNGPTLGTCLRDGGYRTAWIGKWHLSGGERDRPVPPGPHRQGFDHCFLTNNCHLDFRPGHGFHFDESGGKVRYGEWEPIGQTREAIRFVEECHGERRPFALFVSWHPPHDRGMLPGRPIAWNYDTEPELMALHDPSSFTLRPGTPDNPRVRRMLHGWHAMGSGIDHCVGMVLDTLERLGLSEETLVVYTSDHGDSLGAHGRTVPKDAPEDVSCGVPLIMRFPGRFDPGRVTDNVTGTLDLMPTLLGLIGLPVPDACQGRDLSAGLLDGDETASTDAPLFYLHPFSWRGVYDREGTWAAGDFAQFDAMRDPPAMVDSKLEVLYRRATDPHQTCNLAADLAAQPLRDRLVRSTERWCRSLGDPVPTPDELTSCWGTPATAIADTRDPVFRGCPADLLAGVAGS
jgi:arylsulfatase A-like enzyme